MEKLIFQNFWFLILGTVTILAWGAFGGRSKYPEDGDVADATLENTNLGIFNDWVVNPLNFSRTSEEIIEDEGYGRENGDFCLQRPESGRRCSLRRMRMRWYYSARSRTCRRFTYFGCRGNENNFRSFGECLYECGESDEDLESAQRPYYRRRRPHTRRGLLALG